MGGRTGNVSFYGSSVVVGAGIGRRDTNPLLISLMRACGIPRKGFRGIVNYVAGFEPLNIMKILAHLKSEYRKHPELRGLCFRDFFLRFYNVSVYDHFVDTVGYNDYAKADTYETLYNYGFDDTISGWQGFYVPWKTLVNTLYDKIESGGGTGGIGAHFRFGQNVVSLNPLSGNRDGYEIVSENGDVFSSNHVILATTIEGIKQLIPGANRRDSLYRQIHGQPFLKLYGKFDRASSRVIQDYLDGHYTVVPGVLQKIIPVNSETGVYLIAYNDNAGAIAVKGRLENTAENRAYFCREIERGVGIPTYSLNLLAIKGFYWEVGTHYFEPLRVGQYANRGEFLRAAQHPQEGILVVGECVSQYQGWVEGALESVETGWKVVKQWYL
jgi:hypothetical protein